MPLGFFMCSLDIYEVHEVTALPIWIIGLGLSAQCRTQTHTFM